MEGKSGTPGTGIPMGMVAFLLDVIFLDMLHLPRSITSRDTHDI
jgi:hypothetical protein